MDAKSGEGDRMRLLERYGFSGTSAAGLRSCFDVLSEKKDKIMVLKFVDNVDSLTRRDADSLKRVGNFFDAEVFVVFKRYKGRKIRDKVLFARHGVDCIPDADFETVLGGGQMQRAQKFVRTKYRINPEELKKLRKLYNISIRALASRVGISKDSLYRYEKGQAYATRAKLDKLEGFFGADLSEVAGAGEQKAHYSYSKLDKRLYMEFIKVRSPPFEMLAKRHFRYEIGGDADIRTMKKLASFYKGLMSTLDRDHPFFVTTSKSIGDNISGIPILKKGELEKLSEESALLDIITTRGRD